MARLAAVLGFVIACVAGASAGAQTLGPPIPADQMLRQQNRPLSPPPQVPSTPSPGAPSRPVTPSTPGIVTPNVPRGQLVPRAERPNTPTVSPQRDRISQCQHQATVERVPSSRRQAYIHACMQ